MRRLTLNPGETYRNDSSMQVVITVHEFGDSPGALMPGTVVEVPARIYRQHAHDGAGMLLHADEVARLYGMADVPVDQSTERAGFLATGSHEIDWFRTNFPNPRPEESIPDHDEQRAREQEEVEWRRRAEEQLVRRQVPPPPPGHVAEMLRQQQEMLRQIMRAGAMPAASEFDENAKERARELLRRNLTKQQRKQFDRYGSFVVIGNQSRTPYTIKNTGRVIRLSDQHEFCLQVVGEPVPVEDAMLARKLLLESNEELFLSTANDLTAPLRARGDSDEDRARRQAQREAYHARMTRMMTREQLEAEYPNASLTDRLRALVARTRG